MNFSRKAMVGQVVFLVFRPIAFTAGGAGVHQRPTHFVAGLGIGNIFGLVTHNVCDLLPFHDFDASGG